jgi:hypothetical protein
MGIPVDERIRREVIYTLADLLLQALGAAPAESVEVGNEPED